MRPTLLQRIKEPHADPSTAELDPDTSADPFAAAGAAVGGLGLPSLLGPVLNASGCRLIVFAPCSNARWVLAIYSWRDGATRSVLMLTRPSSYEMPRCPRDWRVEVVDELMDRRTRTAMSRQDQLSLRVVRRPKDVQQAHTNNASSWN